MQIDILQKFLFILKIYLFLAYQKKFMTKVD